MDDRRELTIWASDYGTVLVVMGSPEIPSSRVQYRTRLYGTGSTIRSERPSNSSACGAWWRRIVVVAC